MITHKLFLKAKLLCFIAALMLLGCQTKKNTHKEDTSKKETTSKLELPDRPNILWLVTEDMGPYIPPFGDTTIQTPNLSRLAAEGVRYPNLYSTSGVCAPSRAAIATGMYPSSIGANHMRTTSNTETTGLPKYEAVPKPEVRMISELLRANGYYCTNNYKRDYQFKAPNTAWDEDSPYAHWRNRKENQPFFAVFNFNITHESGLFEPYAFKKSEARFYQVGDTSYTDLQSFIKEEELIKHIPKDLDFQIPPYLPNTEVVRRDLWKMYNNIAEMDQQLGVVLKQLEDDGLLENTLVFFYGDHGGPLPRQKRLIYDSGLNTPMIIRFPKKQQSGKIDKQLVSFVDFAPTLLSLTDINPPDYMQGKAFLGDYQATNTRKYIHAAADRFDGMTDVIRAVRDPQFKYIRNYRPEQEYYLPVKYRERIPTMQELLRLRDEGKLNKTQALWFREQKEPEEFYDCKNDPHEIHNLVHDPAYSKKLKELQTEMDRWLEAIGDQPNLPERELINQLWAGSDTKPITANPKIAISEGMITISCTTKGASVGYKIVDTNGSVSKAWNIYQKPFATPQGSTLVVRAHRIGFEPSEIIEKEMIDIN